MNVDKFEAFYVFLMTAITFSIIIYYNNNNNNDPKFS